MQAEPAILHMTDSKMGSALGVTCESTGRILAELKREHILVTGNNPSSELYNADLERLSAIAAGTA